MLPPEDKFRDKGMVRVHKTLEEEFPGHLETCRNFLRQKSVSATGEGIKETAGILKSFIEELGGYAEFKEDPEFPIVYGKVDAGMRNTLIIYGMYDVQPAEEPNWISPPFSADIRTVPSLGECVFARGAVNSKGALCGLFNTLKTMKNAGGLPVNLLFVLEGEEEIGSLHIEHFIGGHKHELKGVGAVDFDFSEDSTGKVSMHLGLKGIVYMDLVSRGSESAVHGSISAWVSSPVWHMIQALSSLTDLDENITIPGFYDNVREPGEDDKALLKKLAGSFNEKAFLKEMKSLAFKHDLHGEELLSWCLYNPVININGFHSGYTGKSTKTVLPRKASAKIDVRFGPDMEPDEVIKKLKRHLSERGFGDIEITVRDCYTWSKTEFSEPIVRQMVNAYEYHGVDPEIWPMATWAAPYFVFSKHLGLPVVSGGLGHGSHQHSANEYMTVKGLLDFEKFVATFLGNVS